MHLKSSSILGSTLSILKFSVYKNLYWSYSLLICSTVIHQFNNAFSAYRYITHGITDSCDKFITIFWQPQRKKLPHISQVSVEMEPMSNTCLDEEACWEAECSTTRSQKTNPILFLLKNLIGDILYIFSSVIGNEVVTHRSKIWQSYREQ